MTDGTMGAAGALAGPDFAITADLGTQVGNNLFHSFSDFNINTGESATFSGPDAIENVVGRVTGGSVSNIDGLLSSTIPAADLYLVNPSGVIFGPNASLDVQGSFHVSTADQVKFPDGGVFDASDTSNTILSVAPPSAFGFLDASPASITVDRSDLTVPAGETLSFVGGDITISGEGGDVADVILEGAGLGDLRNFLTAPGGTINLVAVGAPGDVSLGSTLDAEGFTAYRNITISDSFLDLDGEGGGSVLIRGGEVVLQNTWISSRSFGDLDGGSVAIRGDNVTLTADRARLENDSSAGLFFPFTTPTIIFTETNGAGRGGDITFEGNTVTFDGGVGVFACSFGSGATGDITITGGDVTIRFSPSIGTTSNASGASGDVTVTADSLFMAGDGAIRFTGLFTDVEGSGPGGDITIVANSIVIDALAALEFINDAGFVTDGFTSVEANTSGGATGAAGTVTMIADSIELLGGASVSAGAETGSAGDSGTIVITARSLELRDGGFIGAFNGGTGAAGAVIIEADHILLVGGLETRFSVIQAVGALGTGSDLGSAGSITITGGTLELQAGGLLAAVALGPGGGGDITIDVERLILAGDGTIFDNEFLATLELIPPDNFTGIAALAPVPFAGDASNVTVTAGSVEISGGAFINSFSNGTGAGGTITLTADSLIVESGARIDASTLGSGPGGDVFIDSGTIFISGAGSSGFTGIATNAEAGSGDDAGDIFITTTSLDLVNGGQVAASSDSTGQGGNVVITASGGVSLEGTSDDEEAPSAILTESTSAESGAGKAGTISLTAPALSLADGSEISSRTTEGDGGTITLVVDSLVLAGGSRIDAGTLGAGLGGSIVIRSGSLDVTGGGRISAGTSGTGAGGDIDIAATGSVVLDGTGTSGDPSGLFTESSSNEAGAGEAGGILVSAEELRLTGGAEISTRSTAADGGDIDLQVASLVLLRDSQITTSVGTGTGSGGNIVIDPVFVILDSGRIEANAFGGPGGNITIVAEHFLASPDSVVEASSALGIDGSVVIDSPEADVSGGLAVLPGVLLDAASRLAQQCDARGGRTLASFVGTGRGGLPARPGGAIASPYMVGGEAMRVGSSPSERIEEGLVLVPGSLRLGCSV